MRVRVSLGFVLVCFLSVVSFCHADDPTADIVGAAECVDCQENNFKTSQAFSGLHVTIDCKLKTGEIKRIGESELDEAGEFKITILKKIIQEKEECFAQLHNAAASPCPAHDTTKIVIKSQDHNKFTFTPAKPLRFSAALCTSKFLWPFFKYPPLPKIDPWKKKWPKITIPPLYDFGNPWILPPPYKLKPKFKSLPPPIPIYKPKPESPILKPPTKPLPPIYKPIPKTPVVKPLPPIYKPIPKTPIVKPIPPIYKPKSKPPVVKPLPPIYKPIPKTPVVKQLPPIYKPIPKPPVVKPLPPIYKPIPKTPVVKPFPPIYKPIPKPPVVKPLPPIYKPVPKPPIVKPLPPIYKPVPKPPVVKPLPPSVPIYEPPVVDKPLPPFPLFPLPPLKKKPCPPFTKIPPKFGYFPKPPFNPNP